MKTITIQISDRDYFDMLTHIARERPGRPLVAVVNVTACNEPDYCPRNLTPENPCACYACATLRDSVAVLKPVR